mmetsp:Transcript_17613/g.28944  ORF Transcript_17613/g.28944 Transcript_17613/m.28944 type:complete len:210 (+) Transcript_17613:543-1172(+)
MFTFLKHHIVSRSNAVVYVLQHLRFHLLQSLLPLFKHDLHFGFSCILDSCFHKLLHLVLPSPLTLVQAHSLLDHQSINTASDGREGLALSLLCSSAHIRRQILHPVLHGLFYKRHYLDPCLLVKTFCNFFDCALDLLLDDWIHLCPPLVLQILHDENRLVLDQPCDTLCIHLQQLVHYRTAAMAFFIDRFLYQIPDTPVSQILGTLLCL